MIQELACGKELFKELKSQPSKSFNESTASLYIRQIADALHYMHMKSIIHRDIKPENIMICNGVLKICDLGYAAMFSKTQRRQTLCGTLEYVSPEMIENKMYNNSVDIWSLGILTYELIHGGSPFNGRDHEEVFQNVLRCQLRFYKPISFECGDFISKLLVCEPTKRMRLAQALKHPFLFNTFNKEIQFHGDQQLLDDIQFLQL